MQEAAENQAPAGQTDSTQPQTPPGAPAATEKRTRRTRSDKGKPKNVLTSPKPIKGIVVYVALDTDDSDQPGLKGMSCFRPPIMLQSTRLAAAHKEYAAYLQDHEELRGLKTMFINILDRCIPEAAKPKKPKIIFKR